MYKAEFCHTFLAYQTLYPLPLKLKENLHVGE